MLLDVACLLYLCVCPKSEVMLAMRKPADVQERALAWAEEMGIGLGSERFAEACGVYAQILGELQDAQFTVEGGPGGGAGGGKKKDLRPAGNTFNT
jgi:hypothetical protein